MAENAIKDPKDPRDAVFTIPEETETFLVGEKEEKEVILTRRFTFAKRQRNDGGSEPSGPGIRHGEFHVPSNGSKAAYVIDEYGMMDFCSFSTPEGSITYGFGRDDRPGRMDALLRSLKESGLLEAIVAEERRMGLKASISVSKDELGINDRFTSALSQARESPKQTLQKRG